MVSRVHALVWFPSNAYSLPGHNIVPGSIPKGTLLYHGTTGKELPLGPEWVATDPEHSYFFCKDGYNHSQQGCSQFTLATTRPLKVVYFDGSSAAKLPYGSLDTQDLITWGKSRYDISDQQRIEALCKWGENFGVDGFVRYIISMSSLSPMYIGVEHIITGWKWICKHSFDRGSTFF